MRQILVIAAALGLMMALDALYDGADVSGGMALAAIGFVVLASFTVGDLLSSIGLPRITGYILSGVVLGPELTAVLSSSVVGDMGVFNTLALGLIALTAGLELELAAMRRVLVTMLATIIGKILLLIVVIGGGLYLTHTYLLPLPVASDDQALVLAAIIAVLGIGTSPAIALAIVKDSGARGRLTELTLGMAVLKDVVVVIALAVTIAIGRTMIAADAGGVAPVIAHMARELGLSIAVGALVGALLILYVKYVHRDLLLGAVGTVLVTAEVAAYLHLELLLVFIAAGFVVRNLSEQEHHLMPALQRVSLPVFVVFFTTAGAKIGLESTLTVLPIAGGVALARAAVYFFAARFGAWIGREHSAVRSNAWLAYLPQAGVTLGLVLLAGQALPELSDPINRLGMAIVTINLLIGPVTLGLALGRSGEIPGRAARAERSAQPAGDVATQRTRQAASARPVVTEDARGPLDPRLHVVHEQLRQSLGEWSERLNEGVLRPLVDHSKRSIARLTTEHRTKENSAEAIRTLLGSTSDDSDRVLAERLQEAHAELLTIAKSLPDLLTVETDPCLLRWRRSDGPLTLLNKTGQRMARLIGLRPKRIVPVQLVARISCEPVVAEAMLDLVRDWFRTRSETLADLSSLAAGVGQVDSTQQSLLARATGFHGQAGTTIETAIDQASTSFHRLLAELGAPSAPARHLHLYEVEQAVERSLAALVDQASRGRELVEARVNTLHADALYGTFTAYLDEQLEATVLGPLAVVSEEILPLVEDALARLPREAGQAEPSSRQGDTNQELDAVLRAIDSALDERTLARLTGLQMKYYRATQQSRLLSQLAARLDGVPGKLVILAPQTKAEQLELGSELPLVTIDAARVLEEELIEGFAPEIAEAVRPVGDLVSSLDARVVQAISVASYGVGVARAATNGDQPRRQAAGEALERGRAMIASVIDELRQALDPAVVRGKTVMAETGQRLAVALGRHPASRGKSRPLKRRVRLWTSAQQRLQRSAHRVRIRVEAWIRATLRRQDVREWMIRSGRERLDAVTMRRHLSRYHPSPDSLDLPPIYAELLSPTAVDDFRLAIAHRRKLDELVAVLQPGKSEDFTSVLIVGQRGSGRTSLMNMIGHRLARRRVIRLDARYHGRRSGLLAAVATELGCTAVASAVADALRRSPGIVLVDDLERFVRPSIAGLADLEGFIDLVQRSNSYIHWVVSVQTETVSLWDPLLQLSQAFGRKVELGPLEPDQLERVIDVRNQMSGLPVTCADGSRRTRLRPKEAHQRYFKALARSSRGNLRRAILIHARSTSPADGDSLVASSPRATGIPFLHHLGAGPLATLALIVRYGELTEADVSDGLAVSTNEAARLLLPLRNAGLVEEAVGTGWRVPAATVDAVCQSLSELGLRSGETA